MVDMSISMAKAVKFRGEMPKVNFGENCRKWGTGLLKRGQIGAFVALWRGEIGGICHFVTHLYPWMRMMEIWTSCCFIGNYLDFTNGFS